MITNLYSESFEKPWNEYDYEDPKSFEVFPRADNENEELKRIRFEAAWAVVEGGPRGEELAQGYAERELIPLKYFAKTQTGIETLKALRNKIDELSGETVKGHILEGLYYEIEGAPDNNEDWVLDFPLNAEILEANPDELVDEFVDFSYGDDVKGFVSKKATEQDLEYSMQAAFVNWYEGD